jgi:SAM-dependent methyltransferase
LIPLLSVTLFLSAALLFVAEPMMGKLILPRIGGTPAVWNTCVMFFQFELLLGYLYAHFSASRLAIKTQVLVQMGVLALGLVSLPIALHGDTASGSEHPIVTVLWLLTRSVGLPLLAIAASAPLLQKWLSVTRDPAARDPFFLYAASNLGSLCALLAYPFLIEPGFALSSQRGGWSLAYLGLLALTATCGWGAVRAQRKAGATRGGADPPELPADTVLDSGAAPTWKSRALWLALAFVPSSLMLSATTYISTDIAAVPLLWIVPLALYLLTYVLAFARRQIISLKWMSRLLPIVVVLATYSLLAGETTSLLRAVAAPLAALFVSALVCHGRLARSRPGAEHLTEFYLWISIGGLLGGVFNTLIAPVVFTRTLEYPAGLVLAALLRPAGGHPKKPTLITWAIDVAFVYAVVAWMFARPSSIHIPVLAIPLTGAVLMCGPPLLFSLMGAGRPLRFGAAIAAIAGIGMLSPSRTQRLLHEERTFFGTHQVAERGPVRTLIHGTTRHGSQWIDQRIACDPLSYYARTGPIGQLFGTFSGYQSKFHIASIGLGAGTMAAYAQPHQQWTFFEINPAVVRIAQDPRYFTYLSGCIAHPEIVLGDARLELARQADQRFDVMVFDAFSSDAIPLHLVTREALALYLRKLGPRGVLAFHISNRFLDLEPVLANLARDSQLIAYISRDVALNTLDIAAAKDSSVWVAMARQAADLGELTTSWKWTPAVASNQRVWTDDYSNILGVLRVSGRE